MIKVLSLETSEPLIQYVTSSIIYQKLTSYSNRVLAKPPSVSSILALNATLVEAPTSLTKSFITETVDLITSSLTDPNAQIATSSVLAVGKLLLSDPHANASVTKPLLETLAPLIAPGAPADVRRLSLVVLRTLARKHPEMVQPYTPAFVPSLFACVRDPIIPIKLAAEQAFLALFDVVDQDTALFDAYMTAHSASLPATQKRSLGDYFKRVVLRLAGQARERREAEGGVKGTLGLSEDEVEDEKEVWSVGRVDLGDVF
jgi:hypothetical protein